MRETISSVSLLSTVGSVPANRMPRPWTTPPPSPVPLPTSPSPMAPTPGVPPPPSVSAIPLSGRLGTFPHTLPIVRQIVPVPHSKTTAWPTIPPMRPPPPPMCVGKRNGPNAITVSWDLGPLCHVFGPGFVVSTCSPARAPTATGGTRVHVAAFVSVPPPYRHDSNQPNRHRSWRVYLDCWPSKEQPVSMGTELLLPPFTTHCAWERLWPNCCHSVPMFLVSIWIAVFLYKLHRPLNHFDVWFPLDLVSVHIFAVRVTSVRPGADAECMVSPARWLCTRKFRWISPHCGQRNR